MNIYSVIENDKVIFKGSAQEVSKIMCISSSELYQYTSGRLKMDGNKKIVLSEKVKKKDYISKNKDIPKKVRKTKYEKMMDYLVSHLERYGNVVCNEKPDKYLPDLRKRGFKVKVNEYLVHDSKDFIIDVNTIQVPRSSTQRIDYVITTKEFK